MSAARTIEFSPDEAATLNGVVGVVLSKSAYEKLRKAERKLREMKSRLVELSGQLEAVTADRDRFRQTTYDLAREFLPLEQWDKEHLDTANGQPIENVLASLQREFGSK